MPQVLKTLSQLLRSPATLLTADELNEIDDHARGVLIDLQVFVPAQTARHVVCDQCHEGHVEEVSRVSRPEGGPGFFISCPEAGWVSVDPSRLCQWKPDVTRLASLLAEAIGTGNAAEPIIRDSAWRIGDITIAGGVYGVFLICPNEHDAADLVTKFRKTCPPESSILVLANDTDVVANEFAAAVPLCAAFQWDGEQLELNHPRVRSLLRAEIAKSEFVFQRSAHFWILRFDGATKHFKDSAGMTYIARLLAEPFRDIPAVSLLAARADIDPRIASGSSGEILDDEARKTYKERYQGLQADLSEAENNNDTAQVEKLQTEMDQLTTELARATGLGGHSREKTDAEKVRKSVSMAVTRDVSKIESEHKPLARHLTAFISMGRVFRYSPENPIDWLT